MPKFVREKMLGGYTEVAGGRSDPECTHVILKAAEYSAEFTEEQARTQIREELFSRDGNWVIGRIGINGRYAGDYEDLISDEKVEPEFLERNIALGGQQGLKMNFKTGYWELSIFHTKPLSRVPEDMRARTVADRRAR